VTDAYPNVREGQLNLNCGAGENPGACARVRGGWAGPALRLAPGETKTGGREKDTIWGDACEALLGAVYLDGGLDAARELFAREWVEEIAALDEPRWRTRSRRLQQWGAPGQAAAADLPRGGPHGAGSCARPSWWR
jgi:ribonuclease-3